MIEIVLDTTGSPVALVKKLQEGKMKMLREVHSAASGAAHSYFTVNRLSGRSGDDLGLNRITGTLSKSFLMHPPIIGSGSVSGQVGWIDEHSAKIASVHELGTVGAGGILKDIVPKGQPKLVVSKLGKFWYRQPMLRFKTSWIATSAKTGKSRRKFSNWIFAKKVSIPPRLRFAETMESNAVGYAMDIASRSALNKVIEGIIIKHRLGKARG